ncbi:hypothetical protein HUW63_30930 [Myxococcus sp. AM001]|nr:hypothetical protein [Myxococcus sp. AM001]
MNTRWTPLSARSSQTTEQFDVLLEGIPAHLVESFDDWMDSALVVRAELRFPELKRESLRSFVRQSRYNFSVEGELPVVLKRLKLQYREKSDFGLDLADYIITHGHNRKTLAGSLERLLKEAGSAWTVAESGEMWNGATFQLQRRVSEPVAEAAKRVIDSAGRAGEHLRNAWSLVYGRSPDANAAYLEAVKAAEAAMVPVVSPNNAQATLGTMLGDMKAAPGKFSVELVSLDSSSVPFDVVLGMSRILWKSQPSRHGTPEERPHSNVTIKAAEGAIHLAVALVQWFAGGVVTRASGK